MADSTGKWIKDNAVAIIGLIMTACTLVYGYGVMNQRLNYVEQAVGQLSQEAAERVKADETKTLMATVKNHADQIRDLTEIVRRDHELLIRTAAARPGVQ